MYDVYVARLGGTTYAVRSNGRVIAKVPSGTDCSRLLKAAVDAVPNGGSLNIRGGTYVVKAPYAMALNPDGTNLFFTGFPVIGKDMHIYGSTTSQTIIQLAPWQRTSSRHVAMMLIRNKGGPSLGYNSFTLSDITFDGNRSQQWTGIPHDGEGAVLVGSSRKNGVFKNLKFINSHGCGLYLGNNGSGPGVNERVENCYAQNCAAGGIMLDTNKNSSVNNCQAYGCRVGLFLNGNDDWQTRGSDNVTATNIKTDSQITCWQVNDFTLSQIEMDCTGSPTSRGLVVRDGNGAVKNSILKTDKTKIDARSGPGATYIYEAARVLLEECALEGYFGVHAVGQSRVEAKNCQITAPGGCFCTTDPEPVSSIIRATGCSWSGKKSDIQEGSRLEEA